MIQLIVYGLLAAGAWTAKNQAQSTLKSARSKAFGDGQVDQKAKDDAKAHELAATPDHQHRYWPAETTLSERHWD